MHQRSLGLIPVPPSVPFLTCAHSIAVVEPQPQQAWQERLREEEFGLAPDDLAADPEAQARLDARAHLGGELMAGLEGTGADADHLDCPHRFLRRLGTRAGRQQQDHCGSRGILPG